MISKLFCSHQNSHQVPAQQCSASGEIYEMEFWGRVSSEQCGGNGEKCEKC